MKPGAGLYQTKTLKYCIFVHKHTYGLLSSITCKNRDQTQMGDLKLDSSRTVLNGLRVTEIHTSHNFYFLCMGALRAVCHVCAWQPKRL